MAQGTRWRRHLKGWENRRHSKCTLEAIIAEKQRLDPNMHSLSTIEYKLILAALIDSEQMLSIEAR